MCVSRSSNGNVTNFRLLPDVFDKRRWTHRSSRGRSVITNFFHFGWIERLLLKAMPATFSGCLIVDFFCNDNIFRGIYLVSQAWKPRMLSGSNQLLILDICVTYYSALLSSDKLTCYLVCGWHQVLYRRNAWPISHATWKRYTKWLQQPMHLFLWFVIDSSISRKL